MSNKRSRPAWDSSDDASDDAGGSLAIRPAKKAKTADEEWDDLGQELVNRLAATVSSWRPKAREAMDTRARKERKENIKALAEARGRAEWAEESAAAARTECSALTTQLADERKRRKRVAGELAQAREQLSVKEKALEYLREELDEAQRYLEEAQEDLEEVQEKLVAAEERADELQSDLDATTKLLAFADTNARQATTLAKLLEAAQKRANAAENRLVAMEASAGKARPATGVRTRAASSAVAAAAASSSSGSSSNSGRPTCTVCLSSPPDLALRPCGHVCVCEECYEELDSGSSSAACPMCRAKVTSTLKVFICTAE